MIHLRSQLVKRGIWWSLPHLLVTQKRWPPTAWPGCLGRAPAANSFPCRCLAFLGITLPFFLNKKKSKWIVLGQESLAMLSGYPTTIQLSNTLPHHRHIRWPSLPCWERKRGGFHRPLFYESGGSFVSRKSSKPPGPFQQFHPVFRWNAPDCFIHWGAIGEQRVDHMLRKVDLPTAAAPWNQ